MSPDELSDLAKLYKACDSALSACNKANRDKSKVISEQQRIIEQDVKDYQKLQDAQNGILNNKGFWFVLGTIVASVFVYFTKH